MRRGVKKKVTLLKLLPKNYQRKKKPYRVEAGEED